MKETAHKYLLTPIAQGRCLTGLDSRSGELSKFIAIDAESNDEIVHVLRAWRFRKTSSCCRPHTSAKTVSVVRINGVPQPPRVRFAVHVTPHCVQLGGEPPTALQCLRAADRHLHLLRMQPL